MHTLGEFRLHLICESINHMDVGGCFGLVPRTLYAPLMPPAPDNTVPMPNHLLLVQTPTQNILVDTGMGDKVPDKLKAAFRLEQPRGTVHDSLARIGLGASDIHIVINTHLHGDHCSGNTTFGPDGALVPTFPNAQYYVQAREYADAMHPNERSRATYAAVNFQPLVESGRMTLLEGDTDIAPGVRGVVTPGHTPGHMSVMLTSGGQHALFVCDMASFAIHFERLGWMTAYDIEPMVTLETKRRWQAWALETGALLFFAHDPQRPAGIYRAGEDGRAAVQPVDFPLV
jgi:glyoxylase-like metal-dependent hydrolase (beta-lactamase superfamily II)